MATRVIALMGQVTRAKTAELLGVNFSDWKLRKDSPATPGSTVRGFRSRKRDNFVLACASLADLERAGRLLAYEGFAANLTVVLSGTARSEKLRLFQGSFPPETQVELRTIGSGFVFSAKSDSFSIDIGRAVSSLVSPPPVFDNPTRVAVEDVSLLKLTGRSPKSGVGLGSLSLEPDSIPPYDLFLSRTDGSLGDNEQGTLKQVGVPLIKVRPMGAQSVDLRWVSPLGFEASPAGTTVELSLVRAGHRLLLTVSPHSGITTSFDISFGLTENVLAELRPYRDAYIKEPSLVGRRDLAELVAALGCAGVPVRGDGLISAVEWGDLDGLRGRFTVLDELDLSDDVVRQLWSVETRRLAMEQYSVRTAWLDIEAHVAESRRTSESVSVLVPSRRPEFVEGIVKQIIHQSHTNREVLIGLHGFSRSLILEMAPWLREVEGISFIELDAALNLGQVLGRLSEQAAGDFLAKMDDDDLYTKHHLQDLLSAWRYSEADLVGCKAEFIYLEGQDQTIQRRPNSETYGASVTGGTLLMKKGTLQAAGGWSSVGTAEDRLLQEAITALGGKIYRAHGMNYLMRRGDGARVHTWNPDASLFDRQAIRKWSGLGYPGWRISGGE